MDAITANTDNDEADDGTNTIKWLFSHPVADYTIPKLILIRLFDTNCRYHLLHSATAIVTTAHRSTLNHPTISPVRSHNISFHVFFFHPSLLSFHSMFQRISNPTLIYN